MSDEKPKAVKKPKMNGHVRILPFSMHYTYEVDDDEFNSKNIYRHVYDDMRMLGVLRDVDADRIAQNAVDTIHKGILNGQKRAGFTMVTPFAEENRSKL